MISAVVQGVNDLYLDPDTLTTHGVILGTTGSGKTGLAISLLEDMLDLSIPFIAIDPKGDIVNIKDGANGYDESVTIYTPASNTGVNVGLLGCLNTPAPEILANSNALSFLAVGTAQALLSMIGEDSSEESRVVTVLAQVLKDMWLHPDEVTLPRLILGFVQPETRVLGGFTVDEYLPRKARQKVAQSLNTLLASPRFKPWLSYADVDIDKMMQGGGHIFYLNHLPEGQRDWFMTLLMNRIVTWTRLQPGSKTLRGLIYIDECHGLIPPHPHNPPTKSPIMYMIKQARAQGIGMLLATQNPVDIDYKALGNVGTWMVGQLHTKRDQMHALQALPGTQASAISALNKRDFLVRLTDGQTIPSRSRDVSCNLTGPMIDPQIAAMQPGEKWELIEHSAPPIPPEGFEYWYAPVDCDNTKVWTPQICFQVRRLYYRGTELMHSEEVWVTPDDLSGGFNPPAAVRGLPTTGIFGAQHTLRFEFVRDTVIRETLLCGIPSYKFKTVKSEPNEDYDVFSARVINSLQVKTEEDIKNLKKKKLRELDKREEAAKKLFRRIKEHEAKIQSRKLRELVGLGESLFKLSRGNIPSVTAAANRRGSVQDSQARLERYREEYEALVESMKTFFEEELQPLLDELQDKLQRTEEDIDSLIETKLLLPRKGELKILDTRVIWT